MNKRLQKMLVVALALAAVTACDSRPDLSERYMLEKQLWKAQMIERKMNISLWHPSHDQARRALVEFRTVLELDPLKKHDTSDWDPLVVADIKRVLMVSRVAVASLYFLIGQYDQASDFYRATLKQHSLPADKKIDVEIDLARSLYVAGEVDTLQYELARMIRDISDSDEFWDSKFQVRESFLSIPAIVARIYKDLGDEERFIKAAAQAEVFYLRVLQTWDNPETEEWANYALLNLKVMGEDWYTALELIEGMLASQPKVETQAELELLRAEILYFALERKREGRAAFSAAAEKYDTISYGHAARLNLARAYLNDGDLEAGLQLLNEIESADDTPSEIRSRAMLSKAVVLQSLGLVDQAIPVLRRLMISYPHTSAAIEAPLVITEYFLERGDSTLARRNLDKAKDYYLSLIARSSNFTGNKYLVQDFLIENYLLTGQVEEIAGILEENSRNWDDQVSAGGLLRSGVVYLELMDDRENAIRVFKKCIELFPGTRFAKIAQEQLSALGVEG